MAAKTTKTKRAKKTPLELFSLQIVKGFEKTYSDDRSGYWYSKKIKHAFLKDLEVCIQEAPRAKHLIMCVYCAPQGDSKDMAGHVIIHQKLYTTELQLMKLLDWLQNDKG